MFRREMRGGAERIGIEHDDVVAHGARGGGEHATELPAAEQAECAAGQNHFLFGSGGSVMA